jgi:S1-C subfamily serine protease
MLSHHDDPRNSRHHAPRTSLLWFLVLIVLIAGLPFVIFSLFSRNSPGLNENAESRPVTARGELAAIERMNIEIYEHASPSVVHVTNLRRSESRFNLHAEQVPKGTGSGFVWDQDGNIITNYHVIEGADSARVTLADQTTYEASHIWGDPSMDIAVIQIAAPKEKLRPIMIGTSHDLKVGQLTYAIGNPFGLDHTLTTGIVSALGRQIDAANGRPIHGAIQTSAAINPGNSGGPLLDSAGRLIGMNTSIISPSGAFAGIGFAIPVDQINQIVPQLIKHGKVVRPQLGIQVAEEQVAHQLGIDKGVLVIKVMPNSPAAEAGIQGTRNDQDGNIHIGDVIVSMDGKPISNIKDIFAVLDAHKVGDTIKLAVVRDGQRQEIPVKL